MFKKILAATDLITDSDVRVLTSAQIAGQNNAKLHIIHVLESASLDNRHLVKHFRTGEEILTNAEYEQTVKKEIDKVYAQVLGHDFNYEISVTPGFPCDEILKWAREIGTDLIVLGPHSGRAEEKGVVRTVGKIGSTAEGVIMRENCPVMIVNSSISNEKIQFKKVLVGIDFSNSCECALCFAVKISQRFQSELFTFHMLPVPPFPKYSKADYDADIETSGKKLREFCHEFLDGTNHEYGIWGGALPHLEILKCAEKNNADLIVMGSHTKEKAGKWYAGSVVERVSFRSACPVIVVTDPDALISWEDDRLKKNKEEKDIDRSIQVFSKKSKNIN